MEVYLQHIKEYDLYFNDVKYYIFAGKRMPALI